MRFFCIFFSSMTSPLLFISPGCVFPSVSFVFGFSSSDLRLITLHLISFLAFSLFSCFRRRFLARLTWPRTASFAFRFYFLCCFACGQGRSLSKSWEVCYSVFFVSLFAFALDLPHLHEFVYLAAPKVRSASVRTTAKGLDS